MEFNLIAILFKYKEIERMMGEKMEGFLDLEAVKRSVKIVSRLNRDIDIGIPEKLGEVGVKEEIVPEMAR